MDAPSAPVGGASSRPQPFHVPSLDGLRALAFLLVFVNHAGWHPISGRVALQLFFVLSGYLITTLLRREWERTGTVSVAAFYLRRALRILPPLYLVLAVLLALSLGHVLRDRFTGGGFAATAFQVSNYLIAYGHSADLVRAVTPWWSLAVEEHFYLLFPVVFLLLFRWRSSLRHKGFVLAAVAIAMLAYRTWILWSVPPPATYARAYFPTEVAADAILWGCVLALVANPALDAIRGSRRRWLGVVLPLALAAVAVSELGPRRLDLSAGLTVQALAFAAVLVAVVRFPDSTVGRFLAWRPLAFLGVLSYAAYLVHYAAIVLAKQYLPGPRLVQVPAALLLTLAAALAIHVVVERPCARWRRRLARDTNPVADVASVPGQ